MLKQTLLGLALTFGFNATAAKLILKSHYTGNVFINDRDEDEILAGETLAYVNLSDGEYLLKIGDKFKCNFAIKNDEDITIDTRAIEAQTVRPVYNFLYGDLEGTEQSLEEYKKLVKTDTLDGVYAEINDKLGQVTSVNKIVSQGLLDFAKESEARDGRVRIVFAKSGRYRSFKGLKANGDKYTGSRYSKKKKKWYKSSFSIDEVHNKELIKFAQKNNSEISKFFQIITSIKIDDYTGAFELVAKLDSQYKNLYSNAIAEIKSGMAIFKIKDIQKPKFDLPFNFYDIIPDKTPDSLREPAKGFFTWLKGRTNANMFTKLFAKSHGKHKAIYLQTHDDFFDMPKQTQNDYLIGMWYQWQQKLVHGGGVAGKDKVHVIVYNNTPTIASVVYFNKSKNSDPIVLR